VIAIPLLTILSHFFPGIYSEQLKNVLAFSVALFPFTLGLAITTGVIDGLTRFKTLKTPLLRVKIIFSLIILTLSIILFFIAGNEKLYAITLIVSFLSLGAGVQLGLWGKKLINVILPGTYPQKKGSKEAKAEAKTEADPKPEV
jgi:hypothetical protein